MLLSRLFSQFLILVVAVTLLYGCGFEPLYAPKKDQPSVGLSLALVQVETIPNRTGQQLRNALIQRLNPAGVPSNPQYTLDVRLQESQTDLGIERDTTVTFGRLVITAYYTVTDINSGEQVFESIARSTNSYNIPQSPYATLVAEQDARDRAVREISEDIRLRLATFFKSS